ncbi:MAG: B12-binding domain-containing radical SAM protein [Nitrososphaerota archaeon]|jgi:magnesium-protoporphyrin IX monomethyl ester (oxidative) cyclase|nr:B12-binding domain-containing radical SAM protein [Nitrososphaerota archaeon]
MKILLINPPQTFYPGSELPAGNLPIGLMYIASVLQKAGYQVEILDAFFMGEAFKHTGETATVGLSFTQIRKEIQTRKPDIVGIAGPFTSQIGNAIKTSQVVKEADPTILTVVGGPHVSLVPKEFLKETLTVDIVVCGEGESAMREIVHCYEHKKSFGEIKGIAYRQNDNVIVTPLRPFIANLDELPYPAYDLVDMEQYLNPHLIGYRSFQNRAISMVTSRGCMFNCCFCAVHLHMGKSFRAHSTDYVLTHIQYVVDKYGVKNIFFEDDNLTFDLKRFEAICEGLIERKIPIGWETPNGVRADCLNLALLKKMKRSGAKSIFVGVESGDQKILDNVICKSLDLNRVIEFAKNAKAIGLKTGAFYIIGFPGETKANMQRTVDFALELKQKYDVGMHLFIATPSFGTRLYEDCQAKGYINAALSWDAYAQARQPSGMPLITTPEFTPVDVKMIAAEALARYKKLSLLNHIKNPRKALETAFDQPQLILKYLKNLTK